MFNEENQFSFYLNVLQNGVPYLTDFSTDITMAWFQQNGMRPPTASIAWDFMLRKYLQRALSNIFCHVYGTGSEWSPLSPDLNQ
jgi:hypothetical protein